MTTVIFTLISEYMFVVCCFHCLYRFCTGPYENVWKILDDLKKKKVASWTFVMVSVFLVFDIFQNIFDSLYCYGA